MATFKLKEMLNQEDFYHHHHQFRIEHLLNTCIHFNCLQPSLSTLMVKWWSTFYSSFWLLLSNKVARWFLQKVVKYVNKLVLPLLSNHSGALLPYWYCLFCPSLITITLSTYDPSLFPINNMIKVHNMIWYSWLMHGRLRYLSGGPGSSIGCYFFRLRMMFIQTLPNFLSVSPI